MDLPSTHSEFTVTHNQKLFTTIRITFEHSFGKHVYLFDNYYKIDSKKKTCEFSFM